MGALKELIKHFKDGGYEKDVAGLQEISDRLDRLEQQAHSHAPSVTIAGEVVPESTIYTQDERNCDSCDMPLGCCTRTCDENYSAWQPKAQEQFAKADEVDGDRREAQEQGGDDDEITTCSAPVYGLNGCTYRTMHEFTWGCKYKGVCEYQLPKRPKPPKEQGGDDLIGCSAANEAMLRNEIHRQCDLNMELTAQARRDAVRADKNAAECSDLRAHLALLEKENAELKRQVSENHDWVCGCGHWNGPSLANCGMCKREPGAKQ